MKKLLTLFLATSLFWACNSPDFVITGTITSTSDSGEQFEGKTVELKNFVDGDFNPIPLATGTITNSKFKLEGSVDSAEFFAVFIGDMPNFIFLEKGKIEMNVDLDDPSKTTTTGTLLNNASNEFRTSLIPQGKKLRDISEKYNAASNDDKEILKAQKDSILNEAKVIHKNFISNNNNLAGAYVYLSYLEIEDNPKSLKEAYSTFSDEIKSTIILKGVREHLEDISLLDVGNMFIDLTTMQDPNGNDVKLSDYVGKGKCVLVDFWASWCPPCRAANPSVVELYNKYKNKGFDIVGVSLDKEDGLEDWKKAIKDDGLTWKHMSDLKHWDSEARSAYKLKGIPFTMLFDEAGKILATNPSIEDIDNILNTHLK